MRSPASRITHQGSELSALSPPRLKGEQALPGGPRLRLDGPESVCVCVGSLALVSGEVGSSMGSARWEKGCFPCRMIKGCRKLRARAGPGIFGAWWAPRSPVEGRDGTNCPLTLPGWEAANPLFSSHSGAGALSLVDLGMKLAGSACAV